MASPPSSPEDQHSSLPALYEDPWRRLHSDLAALVATGRLKVRELWRRNREGRLARPAFWPRSLAPLFWPLLMALGLALLVALALRLPGRWPVQPAEQRNGAVELDASARLPGTAVAGPSLPSPFPGQSPPDGAAWPPEMGTNGARPGASIATDFLSIVPTSIDPTSIDPTSADPPGGDSTRGDSTGGDAGTRSDALRPGAERPGPGADRDSSPQAAPDGAATRAAPPASPPSRLAELVGADPPAWVLELEPRPAEGLLRLRLGVGYGELSAAERTSLAEQWLLRSRELGYERLELLDPADHLLARPAQVGSGMILLDSAASPP